MRGNRSKDTTPELILRRELWRRGLRYRLHADHLPGKPDLVFLGPKVAVFCDGDFWHGRDWPSRKEKLRRGSNPDYWIPKIRANKVRDKDSTRELQDEGWTVIRFWETDIKRDIQRAADIVERSVR